MKKKKDFVLLPGTVSEMVDNYKDLDINVPFAPGVNIKKLIKGDKDPLFVTIEVVNSGVARSKRNYTPEVIKSIANQINKNKPEAYEGHLKQSERPTKRPRPVTLWLGAVTREIRGKLRLFAKGYILPYAKELKEYLKAAKASSKKVAVSIYGQANQAWDSVNKIYNLSDFYLESIDWARSGTEGVRSLGYLHLASEMKGEDIMKREDIVKDLKIGELKEFNPTLILEMREEVKTELRESIKEDVKKELKKKIVSEMIPVREQLAIDKKESVVKVVSEMQGTIKKLRKTVSTNYINNKLREKVKNVGAREVIKTMIISEMNREYNEKNVAKVVGEILKSDETKAIIKEMNIKRTIVSPTIDNRNKGKGRKYTKIV